MANKQTNAKVDSFNLEAGDRIARKYLVTKKLGEGYEGEVYLIRERGTGIERAAKLFYPQRNVRNRAASAYARTLHKLRDCSLVIQYHNQELVNFKGIKVAVLVSEYVHGEILSNFIKSQRGKRLTPFKAAHLLHTLAAGLEEIHECGEYHGDLHSENVFVSRFGLEFELKLVDLYRWPGYKGHSIRDDIDSMIRIFYDALGGAKHYARQPAEVKYICCGLKRTLLKRRFPSARAVREHLESLEWQ